MHFVEHANTFPVPNTNTGKRFLLLVSFTALLFLASCGTAPYQYAPLDSVPLEQRAENQTFQDLAVSAAVPSAEESETIFGVPLYEHDIQPVWLKITNQADERIRFSPVGVDPDYFSPLEVAYTLRKGFSKTARQEMDERFNSLGIPRMVDPGETISGFVFTHLSPGTKSFNVDLFGGHTQQNFAFFIKVPGFVPDHAEVDFKNLYTPVEQQDLDADDLRAELSELACCTHNEEGEPSGLPINLVIIGNGRDVLRAMLRAGWYETQAGMAHHESNNQSPSYLFGRTADATFRIQRNSGVDRNELQAWLSPYRLDGEAVWICQVTNFVGRRSYIGRVLFGAHLDPDIDDARAFTLQSMWYGQTLEAFAWVSGPASVTYQQPQTDFNNNQYFTDGFRAILWLSGTPYSVLDTAQINWDEKVSE